MTLATSLINLWVLVPTTYEFLPNRNPTEKCDVGIFVQVKFLSRKNFDPTAHRGKRFRGEPWILLSSEIEQFNWVRLS